MPKKITEERGELKTDYNAGYHYDEFEPLIHLAIGPTMTYSCAYFAGGAQTLDDAQYAKLDLVFKKIGLEPGHRLLDIGCGWGTAALRAHEKYGASAVGLTLSKSQFEYAQQKAQGKTSVAFKLQGWETYSAPCDRIIAIGSFEHFGSDKYAAFFTKCRELLPANGLMLVQSICIGKPSQSIALFRFAHLVRDLYQGGELPKPETVVGVGRENGFEPLHVESLRVDYARSLEAWASNLESNHTQALAVTTQEVYDKFMYYLTTAAKYYRSGETNLYQFLFRVI